MDEVFIYRQITEKIRQDILTGKLSPGDRLPSVREMARTWNCTIGTIQRAYQELARHDLVTSRSGQGTHVVDRLPAALQAETPLRRAALVHRAEAFLLEALSTGYQVSEIETAVQQAMDRWRVAEKEPSVPDVHRLRFVGSHDPVVVWLAGQFPRLAPGCALELQFAGSLGGLIALAQGKADIAGTHLWDEESNTYNLPFIRRFFPRQRMALITLAHRRLGLILPPGNPAGIFGLDELSKPKLRFASRQPGSGTRVWLDSALARQEVTLHGSTTVLEFSTHSDVGRAIAEGQADVGIGVQATALSFSLDFVLLARERYDLVTTEAVMATEAMQRLVSMLQSTAYHAAIDSMGGYETESTGVVSWVE
jgi:putative molybdopterin biosynthesis protein